VRRFRAFFAGRHSAKESATHFRANLSTVSWVGVEVEGWACADKVGKDSEWVVTVVECSEFKAAVEDSGSGSDGPGSTLRNPFSTICGFAA
jgi:hypothetical protein